MNVVETARRLVREGRPQEAVNHVETAAEAGDEEALLTLANWRIFGAYGSQDIALAHRLLERAAAAGSTEAARLKAYLVGNGTGCRSDPSTAAEMLAAIADRDPSSKLQIELLASMPPPDQALSIAVESLCEDPPVRMARNLISEAECQYLQALAEPHLQRSFVIDPTTRNLIPNPIRTSDGMTVGPTQEDLVVHAINRRIAAASGTQVASGEPLHILRYAPGQEYRPHFDALPGVTNQREWTVLVYLNSGYSGGETNFPEIGLTAKGEAGDALIFRNVDEQGERDLRTRHAGLPVTSGIKWLATRWIRQAPHDPWAP